MSTKCELVVNGKRITARIGDTILNALLFRASLFRTTATQGSVKRAEYGFMPGRSMIREHVEAKPSWRVKQPLPAGR